MDTQEEEQILHLDPSPEGNILDCSLVERSYTPFEFSNPYVNVHVLIGTMLV